MDTMKSTDHFAAITADKNIRRFASESALWKGTPCNAWRTGSGWRAFAVAFCLVSPPLYAQTMDDMREQLKRLRAEVNELKRAKPADAVVIDMKQADSARWGDRIQALEAKSKDVVEQDAIGSTLRLQGSNPALRVYGQVEAHAIRDFKQSGTPDVFSDLAFQPLDGAGGQRGKTQFSAETSRFGFETLVPMGFATLKTKVEADFYSYASNNRNRVRLRQAYGEYGGWLIGQTWSTFMDLDNLPETVDFNGPIGAPFSRRSMVRYSSGDAKGGYKFTFAAEDPADQSGGASANERMPQLVARVDKSFDRGAFNLRVLVHEKRSFSQVKRGFGIGLGGSYKLSGKDTLMGQYTRVDGDVDQLYGSNGYVVDAASGNITFDKNHGLVLGYSRRFTAKLRGNAVLGFNRAQSVQAVDNKTLSQAFINLIYSPIKDVDLGGELIYGRRKTFGSETGTLVRLDLMGRYSF
jgi:DcaP outer membrane protein